MNFCRNCGSNAGYYYRLSSSVVMTGAWGKKPKVNGTEINAKRRPKDVRCVSCNVKTNRKRAGDKSDSIMCRKV